MTELRCSSLPTSCFAHGGERDVLKLLDLGLVKERAVGADPSLSSANSLGTPQYMAPESLIAPESATRGR
jgi:serine/threonine protein kinase